MKKKKKKKKKKFGDIILLHKCTINHDHICYIVPEIWYVMDVIVIFIFWTIFSPLHQ